MLSGLCRQKLLQQKWLAYKSSFVSIEILASKGSDAGQGRAPRETTEKNVSKIGVDFGPESGVDLAWIFWGREQGLKISGRFRDRIRARLRAAKKTIRDRTRDVKTKIPGKLPPYFPLCFLILELGSELLG